MIRIFYALKEGLRCRWKIRAVARSPESTLRNITELTPDRLKHMGITHLVLDFDGVLAAHGESAPRLEVNQWLKTFDEQWPKGQIFLLTNKPFAERLAYLQRKYPNIDIISGFPKKPYPQGLLHIISTKKVAAEQVALVDDRLLTGVLACCLAGTQAIYVTRPYTCIWRRPIQEVFFGLLRFSERLYWS